MSATDEANSEHQLDLALAAELQAALLPRTCPTDCPHQVAAARNRMSATIGGDFHDFLRVNDEQIAMVVGDVVGHGVRSSLLMAQIMGYLRSIRPNIRSRPSEVIALLNRMLIDLGERTNSVLPCTLFYAVIDLPSGVCFFVNCGHPRPFLCTRDGIGTLTSGNILLGVQPFDPVEDCITFEPGQRLVLYTDGIPDAADPSGQRFGDVRLRDVIGARLADNAKACADAIFDAVADFRSTAPQTDDETVVVIDRT